MRFMISRERQDYHSDEELIYWLAFEDKSDLISTHEIVRIFDRYGSLRALWQHPSIYHNNLGGSDYGLRRLSTYIGHAKLSDLEKKLKFAKSNNYKIIQYIDEKYPRTLKATKNPPLFVFHKGSLLDFDECIAVAGTRDASSYGRAMARKISKTLASKGYTIVSGLARGIDEWAHVGALEAQGGRTVAVLAWMNPVYPSEHSRLAEDISKRGAIISERLVSPKDRSVPSKFVQRNYITSGISRCVIAVESGKEGGTVHQVQIALHQGKKVFVLKPKGNKGRAIDGFRLFVNMGATPVRSTKDLLERIGEDLPGREKKLDSFAQYSIEKF